MAVFRFRLEPVLRIRIREEEECQRALGQVLRKRAAMVDDLRALQESIVAAKHELGQALRGRVDLAQIGQYARYAGQNRLRAQDLVRSIAQFESQVEAARERLLLATRRRKALELLKERQRQRWQAEIDRREAVVLDELATQGFMRRLQAGDSS